MWVGVTLAWHRCGVDLASIWRRFGVDLASVERRWSVGKASMWRRCGVGVASALTSMEKPIASFRAFGVCLEDTSRFVCYTSAILCKYSKYRM